MSVAASSPSGTATPSGNATADQLIDQRIEEARRALWWGELVRTVLLIGIGAMLALLLWLVMDHWIYSPGPFVRLLCLAGLVGVAAWLLAKRAWPLMSSRVTAEYAAWALERDHPEYRQQLTSYVTLKTSYTSGLRSRIVGVIGRRAASLLQIHDELPSEATGTFRWWLTAVLIFGVLAAYIVASPKSSIASASRLMAPLAKIDPARRVQITEVMPGDAQALAGRDVDVTASVEGLRDGEAVLCRWVVGGAEFDAVLEYRESDEVFAGRIPLDHSASGRVPYWIDAGDAKAGPFQLDVENVPVVSIQSVHYQPPAYTGRKPKSTSSPAITAIEGTKVTLTATTNRAVEKAELEFNPKLLGKTVESTAGRRSMTISEDGTTLTAEITPRSARGTSTVEWESYRIRVWDANKQSNPDPIVYPIRVIADLPPEVAIVVPQKSPVQVPLNAQQIIEVHAMDADFELHEVTLRIQRGIDTLAEPVVWMRSEGKSGKGNHVVEYRFRPTEHRLRVGDTVRVTATAIDNRMIPGDASVEPNRSSTDPIELRIIDDESDLPEDPAGNDGLSQPDERPASDAQQQSGDQQSGDQQSGEQQSGEGGQSSGDQQSGEQSSGDQQSGQQSAGEQQSGEQQSGEQSSGDQQQSGEQQSGQQQSSGDPAGDAAQPPSGDQPPNENTGSQNTGSQNTGGENANPPTGDQSSSSGDPSGQPPSGDQSTGDDSRSPEGDAEAFERIKDYVEKKQQESQSSDATPPQNQSQPSDQNQSPQRQPEGSDSTTAPQQGQDQNPNEADNSQQAQNQNAQNQNAQNQNAQNQSGESTSNDPSMNDQQQSGSEQPTESEQQSGDQNQSGDQKQADDRPQSGDQNQQNQTSDQSGDHNQSADDTQGAGKQPERQKTGDQKSGDQHSGEQQSREQPASDQQQDDQAGEPSGDPNDMSGDDSAGNNTEQQQPGDETAGSEQAEPSSPEGEGSEQPSPEQKPGDDSSAGEGQSGEQQSGKQKSGEQQPSEQKSGDQQGSPSENGSETQNSPSSNQPNHQNPSSNSNNASESSSSGEGMGTGSDVPTDAGSGEAPPEPDLEYAKKATDMVLDYLEETREDVDNDLLEELNWTEDDLNRFRERWQKVRELEQAAPDAKSQDEFADALRSLGLQEKARTNSTRDQADSLRNLRDSGNRRKAPPAFRDAFDAFRTRR